MTLSCQRPTADRSDPAAMPAACRLDDADAFVGPRITLRLVRDADCTDRYVAWLNDPQVNRYLETRFTHHSLASIASFVAATRAAGEALLAIVVNDPPAHVGNIKIGPVNRRHGYADVSYFIGERGCWGRGYATEALCIATAVAFGPLALERVQAGVYASNTGSIRALEKAGYACEARFRRRLVGPHGREDHLWFGALRDEWRPPPCCTSVRWVGAAEDRELLP